MTNNLASLDKYERIVADAVYSVAILGRVSGGSYEFELIGLGASVERRERLLNRGMGFYGVIGLYADSMPRVALEVELDESAIRAITQKFIAGVEASLLLLLQSTSKGVN